MAEIIDNRERSRFELVINQETAFVDYNVEGSKLVILHTEVPPALQNRGVGSALVHGVLEEVRKRGMQVVLRCDFVQGYIRRHPEFADLVVNQFKVN